MDYTPPVPKTPAPVYELKTTMTGDGIIERGPKVLKDNRGNEFKVPFLPNKKCKKCHGRGYTGHTLVNKQVLGLMMCMKCYPLLKESVVFVPRSIEEEKK